MESPFLIHPVDTGTAGFYKQPVAVLDFARWLGVGRLQGCGCGARLSQGGERAAGGHAAPHCCRRAAPPHIPTPPLPAAAITTAPSQPVPLAVPRPQPVLHHPGPPRRRARGWPRQRHPHAHWRGVRKAGRAAGRAAGHPRGADDGAVRSSHLLTWPGGRELTLRPVPQPGSCQGTRCVTAAACLGLTPAPPPPTQRRDPRRAQG
jgi:hypothetical protein